MAQVVFTFPLLVLMAVSWSYIYLLISLLDDCIDWISVLWTLALTNLVSTFPLALHFRQSPLGPASLKGCWRVQLATVAALEVLCKVLTVVAVTGAPVGDAVTLWNLSVVWATIIQSALRRKAPGRIQTGAVVFTLAGVVLIQKPSFIFGVDFGGEDVASAFPDRQYFYLIATGISLPYAGYFVLTEQLQRRGVHWSAFYLNYSVAALFVAGACTIVEPERQLRIATSLSTLDFGGVALVGVFDVVGRCCFVFALQHVGAEVVAVFSTLEIPVSYILAFAMLGQQPDAVGLVGAGLIFAALVAMAVEGFWKKRDGEGVLRKRGAEGAFKNGGVDVKTREIVDERSSLL